MKIVHLISLVCRSRFEYHHCKYDCSRINHNENILICHVLEEKQSIILLVALSESILHDYIGELVELF